MSRPSLPPAYTHSTRPLSSHLTPTSFTDHPQLFQLPLIFSDLYIPIAHTNILQFTIYFLGFVLFLQLQLNGII